MEDLFARLWTLASDISHRFIRFIEDLLLRDVYKCSLVATISSSGWYSRSSDSSISHSILHDCPNPLRPSDTGRSIPNYERRVSELEGQLPINHAEVLESSHSFWTGPSLFQGFISRLQKTLHGSSSDIGWLQRAPGVPLPKDGTIRFGELLESIRNGVHTLPNSFVYLLIPGLFSNHSPLYFVSTKRYFSKLGLACHIAKIHSEASVEHNAWELKQYIEELYWGSGKRILLLGHSKGGVDAAAALSVYWSSLEDKVAGLALVQCPYGGSPVASDILREGQIADKEVRKIMELLICKLIKGDIRALEDLTYEKRKQFIMTYKLPEHVPVLSFHSEASVTPGVLAMMSHIGHVELPRFPFAVFGGEKFNCAQLSRKVPLIIPLAAAMAVCALHLRLRYGERSDGVVTRCDAEVPGSVVVRPARKFDHAWMVYSSQKNNPCEPDAREMSEALLTLLVETGKMKYNHKGDYH